jgi:hypothetical protein
MGATVQVSMHDTVVPNGERATGLSCINHIEGHSQTTLLQVCTLAQSDAVCVVGHGVVSSVV